jgi:DNA-directed RNA polymerase subunit F
MIGKKVISTKNIPLCEVKEILSERQKQGDLTYEQQQALDYSKKFSKLTPSKAEKLAEELRQIEGLDEDFIIKALDILPTDLDTARLIAYKSGAINEDKLKQVVELASKYAK